MMYMLMTCMITLTVVLFGCAFASASLMCENQKFMLRRAVQSVRSGLGFRMRNALYALRSGTYMRA